METVCGRAGMSHGKAERVTGWGACSVPGLRVGVVGAPGQVGEQAHQAVTACRARHGSCGVLESEP